MKTFLVGGAVRDKRLGIPHKEKDWVVVGATPEEMAKKGFRPVGKDFPVFLHPVTHEEYALARTERKIGKGYKGFDFNASPDVTLEEDLKRRDLTINAMAETDDGQLIDPFHGIEDLQNKLLRHVSDAFIEDPVRILRVARFAARYAHLGFKIAPETSELMKKMVAAKEVDALVAERVWKELERGLQERNPENFFDVLDQCGALPILFPQIKINGAGIKALIKAVNKTTDPQIRLAVLFHDLSEPEIKEISERYRLPVDYRDLALLTARHLSAYKSYPDFPAEKILDLLLKTDAFRREERFSKFLTSCEIVSGVTSQKLIKSLAAARTVNIQELINAGFTHQALADKINEQRIIAIKTKS